MTDDVLWKDAPVGLKSFRQENGKERGECATQKEPCRLLHCDFCINSKKQSMYSEKKILVGYLLIRSSKSNLLACSVEVIKDIKFENVLDAQWA